MNKEQTLQKLVDLIQNRIRTVDRAKTGLSDSDWNDDTKRALNIFYEGKIEGLKEVNEFINQIK